MESPEQQEPRPPAVYRIKDWSTLYENAETRKIKGSLRFVLLPNKHDGEGYGAIWENSDTAQAVFSTWILLLEVASKAESPALRGWLVRNDGRPHTPRSLHLKTRAPAEMFEQSIPRLLAPDVGWIEEAPQNEYLAALDAAGLPPPPPDNSGRPLESPGAPGDIPGRREIPGTKGREGKGTEETGKHESCDCRVGLTGSARAREAGPELPVDVQGQPAAAPTSPPLEAPGPARTGRDSPDGSQGQAADAQTSPPLESPGPARTGRDSPASSQGRAADARTWPRWGGRGQERTGQDSPDDPQGRAADAPTSPRRGAGALDLTGRELPGYLRGLAAEARVSPHLVAEALHVGQPEPCVISWLNRAVRWRGCRSPDAFFRWGLRTWGAEASGPDFDRAKLLLRQAVKVPRIVAKAITAERAIRKARENWKWRLHHARKLAERLPLGKRGRALRAVEAAERKFTGGESAA